MHHWVGVGSDAPATISSRMVSERSISGRSGVARSAPTVALHAADDLESWTTGRLLVTAGRLAEHAFGEWLDEHGLTHAGLAVLHALDDGPLAQVDLARRCRVESQTMSRTLDRLERDGLVMRERDPRDRRRFSVRRTRSGTARFRGVRDPRRRRPPGPVFDELDDPARFRADLLTVIDRLAGPRFAGRPDDPAPQEGR